MSSYYNKSFFTKKEETDVEALPKITRGKEMDSLLFDLLTTVSPYGKESLISDIGSVLLRNNMRILRERCKII